MFGRTKTSDTDDAVADTTAATPHAQAAAYEDGYADGRDPAAAQARPQGALRRSQPRRRVLRLAGRHRGQRAAHRHRRRDRRRPSAATPRSPSPRPSPQAGTIGLAAAVVLLVVLMIGYYSGGYVAGRMSRFSGTSQGLGVWITGLVVTIAMIALGADLRPAVRHPQPGEPAAPARSRVDALSTGGVVAALVVLVGTLLAALAGGSVGTHYHRRVDKVGWNERLSRRTSSRTSHGLELHPRLGEQVLGLHDPQLPVAGRGGGLDDGEHRRRRAGQGDVAAGARRAGWPGTPPRSGPRRRCGLIGSRGVRVRQAPSAETATRSRESVRGVVEDRAGHEHDGRAGRPHAGRRRRAAPGSVVDVVPARKSSSKWFGVTTSAAGTTRSRMNSGIPGRTNMPRPTSPITGSQQ